MATFSVRKMLRSAKLFTAASLVGLTAASSAMGASDADFGPSPIDAAGMTCVDGQCSVVRGAAPALPGGNWNAPQPAYRPQPGYQPAAPYQSYKPVNSPERLWESVPQYQPIAPQPAQPSEAEQIDQKISARYGNPVVERFVKGTSANRFAELYLEASRLIDGRHIEPTTYQARVDRAVMNLKVAVANPQFQRVHGLRTDAARQQTFNRELDAFIASRPVRTVNDTLQVMSGVASLATRQLGLNAQAVAAEFVYGAAESLDKYSAFNPEAPTVRPSASTGLEDSVVGIGVEIKPHDQGVIVVKPVRGGPAQQGGVQPGDIITSVNGTPIQGRSLDFAVDQIGGPIGSPVMLGIDRNGQNITLSMRRNTVRVYSVSDVQMLDQNQKIGYIKLDKFAEASAEEMDQALWQLYNAGMQSLVIDLRGNPGGLLTTAISLSDKFLPAGTIVSTKGRTVEDNMQEQAHRAKTWKMPLTVLVDENSASASEIFAAAIQENGRGIVVGRRSYGKGTVQTHFPLRAVAGNFKLTTAKFYSPNGRAMADAGVTPDVFVEKLDTDAIVPLLSDSDVRRAIEVAGGQQVRDLANTSERGLLLGQR